MTRVTAVLFVVPLLLPTSLAAQFGKSGELVASIDGRFRAYAPDEENLERVDEGMDQAHERFAHCFGEAPPPVAVVSYRNEAQRRVHSDASLGIPTYTVRQSSSDRTGFTSWPEAGTILIGSPRQLPVVGAVRLGALGEEWRRWLQSRPWSETAR